MKIVLDILLGIPENSFMKVLRALGTVIPIDLHWHEDRALAQTRIQALIFAMTGDKEIKVTFSRQECADDEVKIEMFKWEEVQDSYTEI